MWSKTLLANTIFGNNLHPDLKVKHSKARVSYVAMARVKRTGHNRLTIPVAPYSQFCSNSSLLYEVHTSSCQETILLKSLNILYINNNNQAFVPKLWGWTQILNKLIRVDYSIKTHTFSVWEKVLIVLTFPDANVCTI